MFIITAHNHGYGEESLNWTIGPFSSREKAVAYFEAMKANKVDSCGDLTYCESYAEDMDLDPLYAWYAEIREVELDPVFDLNAPGTKNAYKAQRAREKRELHERYGIQSVDDVNRLL